MSHKYITVPADVVLKDRVSGDEGQKVTFKSFLVNALLADGEGWGGYQGLMALKRIDDEVQERGAPGAVMKLTVADWEKLNKVVDSGNNGGKYGGFHPMAMIQLMGFLDAVKGASDKDPAQPVLESV